MKLSTIKLPFLILVLILTAVLFLAGCTGTSSTVSSSEGIDSQSLTAESPNSSSDELANLETAQPLPGRTSLGASLAAAGQSWFIKFEGVNGETTDDKHKDWSYLSSFSHEISNSSDFASGQTAGHATEEMMITKVLDKSSPLLAQAAFNGKSFPRVTIELQEGSSDQPHKYWGYVLENVFITRYTVGGANTQGRPIETIHLTYSKLSLTYQGTDASGRPTGEIPANWDLRITK